LHRGTKGDGRSHHDTRRRGRKNDLRVVDGNEDHLRIRGNDLNAGIVGDHLLLGRAEKRTRRLRPCAQALNRSGDIGLLGGKGVPQRIGPVGVLGQHLQDVGIPRECQNRRIPGLVVDLIWIVACGDPGSGRGDGLRVRGRREDLRQQRIGI
jgi:hypothetical protein